MGVIVVLNLILNPFSWQHHFVFLLFPLISVYLYLIKTHTKNAWLFVILLISYLLTAANIKYPEKLPDLFQSHVLYGSMLLFYLIGKLLKKYKLN